MTREQSTVCFICGDPGGTNAVIPVIERIRSDGRYSLFVLGYKTAIRLLSERNIPFVTIGEDIDCHDMAAILRENGTTLLVTGTSYNAAGPEKTGILAAKGLHLPTLAVLDFWSNYRSRFCDQTGGLRCVPDKIAIMDTHAHGQMVSEGFDPDILVITGQPAFDRLDDSRRAFTALKHRSTRELAACAENDLLVVFVSQPILALFGSDPADPCYPGYNERIVLGQLITALERIAGDSGRSIVLLIRPHPSEGDDYYRQLAGNGIRIVVSDRGDPRDAVMAADLVAGMYSELLVEACYLGCMVVSLQPGLRHPDHLPTNLWGYSVPVYAEEAIYDKIKSMMTDLRARDAMRAKVGRFRSDGQATGRVADLIYRMLSDRGSGGT
jgi:hypothetical protein